MKDLINLKCHHFFLSLKRSCQVTNFLLWRFTRGMRQVWGLYENPAAFWNQKSKKVLALSGDGTGGKA
jgi:hypothetical protein